MRCASLEGGGEGEAAAVGIAAAVAAEVAVEEVVVVEVGVPLGRESMRTGERERELWLVKNLGKRRRERSESISTVRGSSRS